MFFFFFSLFLASFFLCVLLFESASLIDNFGWFGNPAIELSPSRLLAMLCLALALLFMYRSSVRRA